MRKQTCKLFEQCFSFDEKLLFLALHDFLALPLQNSYPRGRASDGVNGTSVQWISTHKIVLISSKTRDLRVCLTQIVNEHTLFQLSGFFLKLIFDFFLAERFQFNHLVAKEFGERQLVADVLEFVNQRISDPRWRVWILLQRLQHFRGLFEGLYLLNDFLISLVEFLLLLDHLVYQNCQLGGVEQLVDVHEVLFKIELLLLKIADLSF